jgi:hypothetical protein
MHVHFSTNMNNSIIILIGQIEMMNFAKYWQLNRSNEKYEISQTKY